MAFTRFFLLFLMFYEADLFVLEYTKDPNEDKSVILLAFSGLGWNTLYKHDLPALTKAASEGVLAIQKKTAFQTETLPSLHTLVTGLYPEKHGMLSTKMHDLSDGANFDVSNNQARWWNEAEPIWVSNDKRNGTKSALCFWPGHSVAFSQADLTYSCSLDDNGTKLSDPFEQVTLNTDLNKPVMSMEARINKILEWVRLDHRPNFIAAYFEEPFKTALMHGITSNELNAALKTVDGLVAKLIDGLTRSGLQDKINLIITSDGGAVDINGEKKIYLEDYLDKELQSAYDVIDDGPITTILPNMLQDLDKFVLKLNQSHHSLKVYRKEDLPEHFHFNHINRTMPLVLVTEKGWQLHARRIKDPNDKRKAAIGYPSSNQETHSLLIAKGPAFKKSTRIQNIDNVDVYQLLCAAIKLDPRPHDGSGYVFSSMIAVQEKWYWHVAKTVVHSKEALTGVIVLFLVLLFAALYLLIHVIYNASSRCRCPQKESTYVKKGNGSTYASNQHKNEGRKHLLADEDELTGSEMEEDSDVNEYEIKYSEP